MIDAKTGKEIYKHRLSVGATIDSSPLLADGKLYITGENGTTVVLAAGSRVQRAGHNELDGSWTMSSIAVAGSQLSFAPARTCIASARRRPIEARYVFVRAAGVAAALLVADEGPRPTLFIVGDSTVKNSTPGQQGWGDPLIKLFDATKINVENHAIGGRSSRTFQTEGRWDRILDAAKAGDFVLVQMGHNDGGSLDDPRARRGSLPGIGEETREIDNPITKKHEVVHTYGWYLHKYIADARAQRNDADSGLADSARATKASGSRTARGEPPRRVVRGSGDERKGVIH